MNTLELVRALDAVVNLAASVGISLARYAALKDASGGALTDEQIADLAAEARSSVERL